MITLLVEENNTITQRFYNDCILSLQLHQLKCSCNHSGCLHPHGRYERKVKTRKGSFMLKVFRVKCSECGRTHAILLSSIVPYSQITLICCFRIITSLRKDADSVCTDYPDVDENNVKSVIRRYKKHWEQRLMSERISLTPVKALVLACFSHYSAQFMQVHRTFNRIFSNTT
jgi:hypothetical protein